jgi:hypothetical protein
MITNSLDWSSRRLDIKEKIQNLPYNPDLRKLLRNIDDMVDDLNRMEVDARRTKNNFKCNSQIEKINTAINNLEQWLIMAVLIN